MNYLIFLVIFLVIYLIYINKRVEKYDAKVSNYNKEKCSTLCKLIPTCAGFGLSDKNNCYLAKTPILGRPIGSLYSNEYASDQFRCNKIKQISDSDIATSYDKLKNATYTCSDSDVKPYSLFINDAGKLSPTTQQILDNPLSKVIPYETKDFAWPSDFTKQTDKKTEDEIQKIANNIMTEQHQKQIIEKQEYLPYDTFKEFDNEVTGDFLHKYECVSNVRLPECLNYCNKQNDQCSGVEWNPAFLLYDKEEEKYKFNKDICCPMKTIKGTIPRRTEHAFGKFYHKVRLPSLEPEKIYVHF